MAPIDPRTLTRRGAATRVTTFTRTQQVVDDARDRRAFSAVVAEIGDATGPRWKYAAGTVSYDPAARAITTESAFDLASLTKVLATTTLAMRYVNRGALDLETAVAKLIPNWSSADRAAVTVRDLLEHASGLPAHRPYFQEISGRTAYEQAIAREPLEYAPRSRSIYSDLGFMLLGFILEDVGQAPLNVQFDEWRRAARITDPLGYLPDRDRWPEIVATENDGWRGRLLQGEVHDENAAALGGVAAHAGLFGNAAAVGAGARWWLHLLTGRSDSRTGISAQDAALFVTPSTVPGSSRALGWDTMLTTSSCGTCLSPRAIGHTGFTGTSLWIDPQHNFYAVLLTNRVHPTRNNDAIQRVRREFHDAAIGEYLGKVM